VVGAVSEVCWCEAVTLVLVADDNDSDRADDKDVGSLNVAIVVA